MASMGKNGLRGPLGPYLPFMGNIQHPCLEPIFSGTAFTVKALQIPYSNLSLYFFAALSDGAEALA